MTANDRTLQLERPLVAFDLETTGLDVNEDRIIEISCVRMGVDGTREARTRRLNPGKPIAPEATAVHGIRNEDVAHEPGFAQVAKSLLDLFRGCDVTGFNIERFDLPLLVKEFERCGLAFPGEPMRVIDSFQIYMKQEPRDLASAYRYYCGAKLERAHSAEADATAAADILLAQIARYEDMPRDIATLDAFCHPEHPDWLDPDGRIVWKGDVAVLGFGKHRDRSLETLARDQPDYLRWMAGANFSIEVVQIVKAALKGEFPVPEASPAPASSSASR